MIVIGCNKVKVLKKRVMIPRESYRLVIELMSTFYSRHKELNACCFQEDQKLTIIVLVPSNQKVDCKSTLIL